MSLVIFAPPPLLHITCDCINTAHLNGDAQKWRSNRNLHVTDNYSQLYAVAQTYMSCESG